MMRVVLLVMSAVGISGTMGHTITVVINPRAKCEINMPFLFHQREE